MENSNAEMIKNINPDDYNKRISLIELLFSNPIPKDELLLNMGLFIDRRFLSRFLFLNEIYEKILNVHGSILEFGSRYGHNLALLTSLRGIYEPFNHNRKIIGFDTFEGFLGASETHDGLPVVDGQFSVPQNDEIFLDRLLSIHESIAPIESIKKYELVKGDSTLKVQEYLNNNKHLIISLAYFDFDIYQPTKKCLESIIPYLTKGSIIVFDEINAKSFPGETIALREVLGTNNFRIIHSPFRTEAAYIIYE